MATPEPGPKEALVAIWPAGVNFIDVYFRTGLYPAEAPTAIGSEAAGVVERVGRERHARSSPATASCTRWSAAPMPSTPSCRQQLAPIPDDVSFEAAAAVMLQGTTAHYLTRSTFPLDDTHTCLVHAAAGGLGTLLVQMAKERGATVIGTVSTEEKAASSASIGADETILYTQQDFETEVMRLTDGRGVDVVYDSVGQTTFDKGLNVIRPRGPMALVGQSSGPVAPVDPHPEPAWLAVPDAAEPRALPGHPRGAALARRRRDVAREVRRAEGPDLRRPTPLADAARRIATSRAVRRRESCC